jgi:hypothetical protein
MPQPRAVVILDHFLISFDKKNIDIEYRSVKESSQKNHEAFKHLSSGNQFLVGLRAAAALDSLAHRHWHAAREGDEQRFPPREQAVVSRN